MNKFPNLNFGLGDLITESDLESDDETNYQSDSEPNQNFELSELITNSDLESDDETNYQSDNGTSRNFESCDSDLELDSVSDSDSDFEHDQMQQIDKEIDLTLESTSEPVPICNHIVYNLECLIRFIYSHFFLDVREMTKIYQDIEVEFPEEWTNSRNKICPAGTFVPNQMQDNEYVYYFKNIFGGSFFNHLREYFQNKNVVSTDDVKMFTLKNAKRIKLINSSGIKKNMRGIQEIDFKLSFWPEFVIETNDESDLSLHELIIGLYKIRSHKFNNDLVENFKRIMDITVYEKKNKLFITIDLCFIDCFDNASEIFI